MGLFINYLLTYLFGGITFIPLIVFSVWYISPKVSQSVNDRKLADEKKAQEQSFAKGEPKGYRDLKAGQFIDQDDLGIKTNFQGWITVTKEFYRFTQINPDDFKQTTSGEVDLASSNSVNTQDKSSGIFSKMIKGNNGHSHSSSVDEDIKEGDQDTATLGAAKLRQIRKRNRFYGVIKHGNLFLYGDETQKNVKYVIVLDHYTVAIWPRNLTDAQIYMKRSAICLINNDEYSHNKEAALELQRLLEDKSDNVSPPKNSYFLYADLAIQKEDWYFALLKATCTKTELNSLNRNLNPSIMAKPIYYYTSDMLDLIGTLNATENQLTTKWLNALLGRLFLSTYQTERFQKAFRLKIEERLKKIRTPGFLDQLLINRIDVGHSGPFFTNPKLKSLSPEGDMEITIDLLYQGKAMVEIVTKLFVNVTGFKQRQFDIVMKLIVNKIEGEVLIKIKPQPSSRVWYTFLKMPEIDISVEPVFSSRAVSYGIITGILENKLREAIKASIVYPFFDDFVFFRSPDEIFRGGIFDHSVRSQNSYDSTKESAETSNEIDSFGSPPQSLHPETMDDTNSEPEHVISSNLTDNPKSDVATQHSTKSLVNSGFANDTTIQLSSTKTPSESFEEDMTNTSEQIKDSVIKSYSKIKQWYKKAPSSSETRSSTTSDSSLNIPKKKISSNSKDSTYIPPEMISNRRRKPSKPDNLSIDILAQPETPTATSFQLLSSNIGTRPSGDAFIKLDRRRASSQSSTFGSSSIPEEQFSSPIHNSPQSPDMFINEKFRSPSVSGLSASNSNLIGLQSGSHMIPPSLRFGSDTDSKNESTLDSVAESANVLLSGLQESPFVVGNQSSHSQEQTGLKLPNNRLLRKPVPNLPSLPPKDSEIQTGDEPFSN
ncbi:hypothetical protein C6P40_001818 [Pichia californica]|uniref:SMP-LTD domain-containing protein n=1 Tax=Pichia californica TaxID=460514 RepID=A0A9P6WIQ5_9ASCO|nr:hypothetical protein C6P42_005087 [[Candida] californica]KAG0687835.1 hypothetical protein C6P40_001818 [[Candida] californica]